MTVLSITVVVDGGGVVGRGVVVACVVATVVVVVAVVATVTVVGNGVASVVVIVGASVGKAVVVEAGGPVTKAQSSIIYFISI